MKFFEKRPSVLLGMVATHQRGVEADIVARMPPPPPKPVSDTVVGSVVVMLDKSYQTYLQRREALEAEIARSQELLRQTNTVISSLEAALTVAAIDPALTVGEAKKAHDAADARFSAGMPLGVADERTEPSMGFGVGGLHDAAIIGKEPAPPMHWYDKERGE